MIPCFYLDKASITQMDLQDEALMMYVEPPNSQYISF